MFHLCHNERDKTVPFFCHIICWAVLLCPCSLVPTATTVRLLFRYWYYCRNESYPLPPPPNIGTANTFLSKASGLSPTRVSGRVHPGAFLCAGPPVAPCRTYVATYFTFIPPVHAIVKPLPHPSYLLHTVGAKHTVPSAHPFVWPLRHSLLASTLRTSHCR